MANLYGVIVKKMPMSEKLNDLLYFAGNCFSGYPYCRAKDPVYFELLLEEFIELDLLQELKLYHTWTLDMKGGSPIPYRTMFRIWLKYSRSRNRMSTFSDEDDLC